METSGKNLGLLMTRSVDSWGKIPSFSRELLPYIELSKSFKKIYIFSYSSDALPSSYELTSNIKIVLRPAFVPVTLYMFLMPFIHGRIFRQIDILKTNQMDGSWAGVIAKKLFGMKLVVRCGYEWLNYLKNAKASWLKIKVANIVESWSYRNADKIIITSDEDRKFIISHFGIRKEKIEVIGNYIDTDKFRLNESIEKDPKRIIFVGRLHPDKNLLMLVESLEGLDCKLVLVGDGPEKEKIKDLSSRLGVETEFLGKVPQEVLPVELQKSSIFVLVSNSEGNPKALLEAMATGLACIGTNVKGIRGIIDDGVNGLLAESNPESLREKIKILLENQELRDKLGANARAKIEKEYSLPIIIEKEKKIYESLV